MEYGLINPMCSDMYVTSLYYVVITITTVGYGDISPASKIERLLVIVLTIFSCGNFIWFVFL